MLTGAVKLGMAVVCAVLVWGCADEPKGSPDIVQNVDLARARSCRVVDTLRVEAQSSPDEDIERGALKRAQARAIEKGGDAILVRSILVEPARAAGIPSVMVLRGEILACHAGVTAN